MDSFAKRLSTFTSWPHAGQHDPRYMAAAGFYQDFKWPAHTDAATCFHCDCTFTGWVAGEDPATEHVRRNPQCTWIVGKTMNTQEKREATFDNWPYDGPLSHMMVAAAGFYQSDRKSHIVTCHSCQLTLSSGELLPDPLRAHGASLLGKTCDIVKRSPTYTERSVRSPPPERERERGVASPSRQLVTNHARGLPPSPPTSPSSVTTCGFCGKGFSSKREVFSHLLDVHRLNKCRKCRKRFPSGDRLSDHLCAAHGVPKVTRITKLNGKKVRLTGKPLNGTKRRLRNRGVKARANPSGWMWAQDHDEHKVTIKQEPK